MYFFSLGDNDYKKSRKEREWCIHVQCGTRE